MVPTASLGFPMAFPGPLPSAMTPESLLRSLCDRHGLPFTEALPLLPLVRRALEAPLEVRDRILVLVDRNLAEKAEARATGAKEGRKDREDEMLIAVARVLHGWVPTEPLLDLGSSLRDLSAQNQNPESS